MTFDLRRQAMRLENRAAEIDDMPVLMKFGAARLLFTDTRFLIGALLAQIDKLEGQSGSNSDG